MAEEKDMTLKIVRKRPYKQSNGQQVSEISHTARSCNLRLKVTVCVTEVRDFVSLPVGLLEHLNDKTVKG